MIEIGEVIEIEGDRAKVSFSRKSGCASCGKCGLGREGGEMLLEAENIPGARPGDRVEVEIPERDPLLTALLLFGLPLLAMLLGVVAGTLLERALNWNSEAPAVVLGIVLLLAAFFLVKVREKRLAQQPGRRNRIARVL